MVSIDEELIFKLNFSEPKPDLNFLEVLAKILSLSDPKGFII